MSHQKGWLYANYLFKRDDAAGQVMSWPSYGGAVYRFTKADNPDLPEGTPVEYDVVEIDGKIRATNITKREKDVDEPELPEGHVDRVGGKPVSSGWSRGS